ncbi:MAG: caspase family protein [Cyanobacteria bacterium J06623_7]
MGLDRRTFLQQAGLAFFTWGAAEAGLNLAGNNPLTSSIANYQKTLAQPTSRKLALLIGINRYPARDDLAGCLTDVELQKELLIHRFGFNPSDILTLRDRQATRTNIETAFIEHLTKQAKADDVVLFHFSGYGGQIKMPLASEVEGTKTSSETDGFRLVNSYIPVDGFTSGSKNLLANSILQETLLVLAQTLSTSKCTFVLDTSFNQSPRNRHSSLKVRSLEQVSDRVSPQELAFLAQLRQEFSNKGLKPSKRLLSLPGVVLAAASNNQIAVERQWSGLSAGLFTQALTQHLWHITPSSRVQIALARTAETVEQVMGRQQQPTLNNPDKSAIAYYLAVSDAPNAVGVVSKVNQSNHAEVKLLGLPTNIVSNYGPNSCFNLVSVVGDTSPQLQVRSKDGLVVKTQAVSANLPLEPGQLVRESVRMLSHNLELNLALSKDLSRIERVDATSALANISSIDSNVVTPEQNADCLIGKIPIESESATPKTDSESNFAYGLYTPGGDLIGKTAGLPEEAVKVAIDRLRPQFNNLLAAKWLELSNNEFSSGLQASAMLLTPAIKSPLWQRSTVAASNAVSLPKKPLFSPNYSVPEAANNVPAIAKGTEIQLNLANVDQRQLYTIILSSDSERNIYALYTPAQSPQGEEEIQLEEITLAPQSELSIPPESSSWKWKVSESTGINTLYVVLSVKPLAQTLKALAQQKNFKLDQQQVLNVINPMAVVAALMQDLHSNSSVPPELLPHDNVYALDVNSWATLKFVYEVTNSQQVA